MSTQYDSFASDYDWVFADFRQTGERHLRNAKPRLDAFRDPTLLDCACGTGVLVVALARAGYRVVGSDASEGMIAAARQHAAQEGIDVPLHTRAWQDLPSTFGEDFDVIFCCGNSIGHCRDADDMRQSLRAIFSVLKPGGMLFVDSRNWEKLLSQRVRFTCFGPRQQGDQRCVPLYVWNFPQEVRGPVVVDVAMPIEATGGVSLHTYSITYQTFTHQELLGRMLEIGFTDVECDFRPDCDGYQVIARKPPIHTA